MKLRNKIIIIFVAAILLLTGIYAISIGVRLQQTEHSYGEMVYTIPKGSLYKDQIGAVGEVFKTRKSEEEIQQFYDNYFATLTPVAYNLNLDYTLYYDAERGVMYKGIDTITRGGLFPTEFTVWIWPWDGTGDQITILENQ